MKLFVWDLHGTLEAGNDRSVVDLSNRVLENFGRPERFTYDDGKRLYGKKWWEYFAAHLAGVDDDYCRKLQDACFDLSEKEIAAQTRWMRPTPHVETVLSGVAAKHSQILISNTRPANLDIFLDALGLAAFFPADRRFAVDNHTHHDQTKAAVLDDYIHREGPFSQVVVIGDSPSDIRLTEGRDSVSYLYTHPDFAFRPCTPDFRVRDLRRVLDSI